MLRFFGKKTEFNAVGTNKTYWEELDPCELESVTIIHLENSDDYDELFNLLDGYMLKDDGIIKDCQPTFLEWDCNNDEWFKVEEEDIPYSVMKMMKGGEEEETAAPVKTTKLWSLIVTLDNGDCIQTNSEPVPFEEIMEAINVLKKPSILGSRIITYRLFLEG